VKRLRVRSSQAFLTSFSGDELNWYSQLFSGKMLPVSRVWQMSDVTRMLEAAERGDAKAAEELLPLVCGELRRLAAVKMAGQSADQTLQPTALVHEAYLRLFRLRAGQVAKQPSLLSGSSRKLWWLRAVAIRTTDFRDSHGPGCT
jgi:hypothetical protein